MFTWHHSAVTSEIDVRAITVNLGTHLPYDFIQQTALRFLLREPEIIQLLLGSAKKESWPYTANSSGGIHFIESPVRFELEGAYHLVPTPCHKRIAENCCRSAF